MAKERIPRIARREKKGRAGDNLPAARMRTAAGKRKIPPWTDGGAVARSIRGALCAGGSEREKGACEMRRIWKMLRMLGLGWVGMLLISAGIRAASSRLLPEAAATTPEPTAQQVILTAVRLPTPEPEQAPRKVEIIEYDNDFSELEILARLLWSSPLYSEAEKQKLLWVVFNRVADQSDAFGSTIHEVVSKHEFTFYNEKAHLSEENLRIANAAMNQWKSEQDGHYIGAHVPPEGVYIRFVGERNRGLEVTAEPGGEALAW